MPATPQTHDQPALSSKIHDVLRETWGHARLRDLQEPAIAAVLAGRDSLVVLPTGGGKSLCYQLPPLITGRPTLVVSPLISLMNDQVASLRANGVPAAALHSGLDPAEQREVERAFASGELKLLFVAPERVLAGRLIALAREANIGAVAIDEAHCISQWGHDFRPEYRSLRLLRERLDAVPFQALTATATPRVREDIAAQLALHEPEILVGVFDRPNLTYRVRARTKLDEQVAEIVRRHRGSGLGEGEEGVIVYCLSRKDTEKLADALTAKGIPAKAYHAGLASTKRTRVERDFSMEKVNVVCATVAFGMGIDRSNVRAVVHACLPRSIEGYQQETGRAGRDGLGAECVLLHAPADLARWRRLIEMPGMDGDPPDPSFVNAQVELLNQMHRLATGATCRHQALSAYFGQAYTPPEGAGTGCGGCDICLGELTEMTDAADVAKKIISCVARFAIHAEENGAYSGQFGARHLVEVLAGAKTKKVEEFGHETLSTYAILADMPRDVIGACVNQLVDQGALGRTPGDMPVIHTNEASRDVLKGVRDVRLVRPESAPKKSKRDEASWEGVDRDLFEKLRAQRLEVARERGVPPYVVFSDASLRDMAARRPSTRDGFLLVRGVGRSKLEDFGEIFLGVIAAHCTAEGAAMDVDAGAPASPPKRRADDNPDLREATRLYAGGAGVDEVAATTGRTRKTAVELLCEYIERERPADIEAWVDAVTLAEAQSAFDEAGDARLKPAYVYLNERIGYDTLRIVQAYRRSRRAPA